MIQKHSLISAIFLAAMLLAPPAFAAPDDEDFVPAPDDQENVNFNVDESNFDQWVFQGVRTAKAGRDRINSRLKLQLDEVDRTCGLTDSQRSKLELAARGDIKRFFDQVEEVRKKFLEVRRDQHAFQNIWQDIQPLQQKLAAGLFGELSLYAKTLRKTLDGEQVAQYQSVLDERQRFRYKASIEVAMSTLEGSVALRNEQREALVRVLLEKTRPIKSSANLGYYVILHRLGQIEKDVKPLLDERQWISLKQQIDQARNFRAGWIQNGMAAADDFDDPAKPANP